MGDFTLMVSVRFPELRKCLQRVESFVTMMETYGENEDMLEIELFWVMLKESIDCDGPEDIPISAFTEMYFCIIKKYFKENTYPVNTFLKRSFLLLFETLVKINKFTPQYCIKFLADIKDASNSNIEFFFFILPKSYIKLILDCLVKQRFHNWGVNDYWLTDWLADEEKHNLCEKLFIPYGFNYVVNQYYFEVLRKTFMEGMRVDGVPVCYFLDQEMIFQTDNVIRMQQAIELLVALFINKKKRNAISLLWKTLPNAFITAKELYRLLKPCVFERYDLLKSLCVKYKKTVHKICPVPKISKPRSLKHLSRVQVRNRLFQVHNLNQDTIGELHIPVTLKNYLWIDEF